MQWYYVKNGQKEGPLSNADIPAFVRRGDITDDTLVWNETMSDWKPFGEVDVPEPAPQVSEPESVAGESRCSMCGKEFQPDELIEFEGRRVCGGCKPTFLQQIKENAEMTGAEIVRYAGFWRRFWAVVIDGIVMYFANLPLVFLMGLVMPAISNASEDPASPLFFVSIFVMNIIQMFIPALYTILMIGKSGATLGKKALGIHVVMSDGSKVSMGRATGRYFATILSGLILNIGYIMAAFDDEKRALHDHMCDTRVVYK